jgi:hypothetical protein
MVEMGDYYNSETATSYKFQKWVGNANNDKRISVSLDSDKVLTASYIVTAGAAPPPPPPQPPASPPTSSAPGTITVYAYRMPNSNWGSTFVSADAQMYFVLYDSTGAIAHTGFFDENGNTITGLDEGKTYWVSPTDCHHCHGGTHDVRFNHWDDGTTERQRPVTTGMSAGAYYEYVPDTP